MRASSETAFYLLELLKIAVPSAGIAFVLVAAIRRYRAEPTQSRRWLIVITAVWLLVTFADRLAFSAPARHHFISAAMAKYAESHRESLYFALTEWLWTAEQIIMLVFGVALFFVFRDESHRHI